MIRRLPHLAYTLAIFPALWGSTASAEEGLSRQEIAKLGKAATDFVHTRITTGTGSGLAFCVHNSGLL